MDIFERSFPPPDARGIPYIAPLANEMDGVVGEPNSCLAPAPMPGESSGLLRRYGLFALRNIKCGEEMTWDYGASYGGRPYASRHNMPKKVTKKNREAGTSCPENSFTLSQLPPASPELTVLCS